MPSQNRHPNGVAGIGVLTVAVHEVATARGWYEQALGRPAELVIRSDLAASGVRFTIGPHTLELLAPQTASSPLIPWLADRGASPYAATLTTAGSGGSLDPSRTLGARLSLVSR